MNRSLSVFNLPFAVMKVPPGFTLIFVGMVTLHLTRSPAPAEERFLGMGNFSNYLEPIAKSANRLILVETFTGPFALDPLAEDVVRVQFLEKLVNSGNPPPDLVKALGQVYKMAEATEYLKGEVILVKQTFPISSQRRQDPFEKVVHLKNFHGPLRQFFDQLKIQGVDVRAGYYPEVGGNMAQPKTNDVVVTVKEFNGPLRDLFTLYLKSDPELFGLQVLYRTEENLFDVQWMPRRLKDNK